MKLSYFVIFSLLIAKTAFTQIDIEDKSEHPKIKAIPYNGEFMSFDEVYEEERKVGVIGEKVTLIDVNTSNIYENEEALKNRKSISSKFQDNFKNKTFEIVDYRYEYFDILTIKNEIGQFIWNVSSVDVYVFNKFIDVVKEKHEGKKFIPLRFTSDFKSIDGTEFQIDGKNIFTISKVKFAKLEFNYGIVLKINDEFECIYSSDNQPNVFNGKIYSKNDNYINISSNDFLINDVTLIEENEFVNFSKINQKFLEKIRSGKVELGMTESQCRWAWGIPSKIMEKISGYEKVLIYGEVGNSQNLYFKGGVLKLIK